MGWRGLTAGDEDFNLAHTCSSIFSQPGRLNARVLVQIPEAMNGLPAIVYASLARRILLWLKVNVAAHISKLSHDDLI